MSDQPVIESGYAPVPGGELFYERAGTGPALIFLHAGIADLRMWDAQLPAFAANYSMVRYDARGFGRSRSEPVPFSNRRDLADLMDHLGIARAALVGCSRGGMIALDFALESPDRVVAYAWVCSGISGWQPADEIFAPEELALYASMEAAEEAGDHERTAAIDVRLWVDGPRQPEGRAPAHVRDQIYAMALENYRTHSQLFQQGLQPQPLEPPAFARLSELRAPVLAIVGELDSAATSAAAEALAAAAPQTQIVRYPDSAHVPSMEHPDRFNADLASFLGTISPW